LRQFRSPDNVDAAIHRAEPTARDTVVDRALAEAEFQQLPARHHAVLLLD
jgi:hypothetical protein